MALNRSITSTNSSTTLAIAGVFNSPQPLRGYATDDIFDSEQVQLIETAMGLDGILSAGYVPKEVKMNFVLQANSPSNDVFRAWINAIIVGGEVLPAEGVISIPSIGYVFACHNGFLTSHPVLPDAKKILQPMRYQITWEAVLGAPI